MEINKNTKEQPSAVKPTFPDRKYFVGRFWDTGDLIKKDSDPVEEFFIWYDHASASPDWEGDEFEIEDFEDYIEAL